jgi:hypothetical protein
MSSAKRYILGTTLLVGGIRLALLLVRSMTPNAAMVLPTDPEAVSQREARKGEQRATVAQMLDASVVDVEDWQKLDEAKGDARRALRELGREASAAGAPELGRAASAFEQSFSDDARRACSLDGPKKLEAAISALSPASRSALGERVEITLRHVHRACELAMLSAGSGALFPR